MYIIDENEQPIKLEKALFQENNDSIYFTVLDFTNQKNIDILCIPLTLCEILTTSVAEINFGKYGKAFIPVDFFIPSGDKYYGNLEMINVMDLIDKELETMLVKPISGSYVNWGIIEVENIYENITYLFPKIRNTQLVAYPIQKTEKPLCVFVGNSSVKNVIIDVNFFHEVN